MAIIKSGSSDKQLMVDPTAKASRITLYDSYGREQSYQGKAVFGFTFNLFSGSLPGTPTDMVALVGSPTKLVKLISFVISSTATAAGSIEWRLLKRSGLNTTPGNETTVSFNTGTPFDSKIPSTTWVLLWPSVSPTLLGSLVGAINIKRVAAPINLPASWAGITSDPGCEMFPWVGVSILDSPVVLRGINESVVLNANAVAILSGQVSIVSMVWTEE